jgi:hypothetical protein
VNWKLGQTMSISRKSKELRAKAEAISNEHSQLMLNSGHDGAAHCPCELAQRYRIADKEFWESREKKTVNILRQTPIEFANEWRAARNLECVASWQELSRLLGECAGDYVNLVMELREHAPQQVENSEAMGIAEFYFDGVPNQQRQDEVDFCESEMARKSDTELLICAALAYVEKPYPKNRDYLLGTIQRIREQLRNASQFWENLDKEPPNLDIEDCHAGPTRNIPIEEYRAVIEESEKASPPSPKEGEKWPRI